MAKIVKSEKGYWVGKELYPQEQYISFGETCIKCPIEKIKIINFDQLQSDISTILEVQVSDKTPRKVLDKLTTELCNSEYGMHYCFDYKCRWGVRKIVPCDNSTNNK